MLRVLLVNFLKRFANINFFSGVTFGFLCCCLFVIEWSNNVYLFSPKYSDNMKRQLQGENIKLSVAATRQVSDKLENDAKDYKDTYFNDSHLHQDDDRIAKDLYKQVRVLCWIMTHPGNLDKKAIHVKKTWGKRCNILLFFSSVNNETFPTIGLNTSEGRGHLTAKTMQAFQYVYDHYYDKADWFMKADDDTYVIMENLRYFLSSHNSKEPVFFGHRFKVIVKQGYYSGGAGYVLSKESLRRFGTRTIQCRHDGGSEDVEMGICLEKLGIKTENSTDKLGRSRFHCFNTETHLDGWYPSWYYKYDASGAHKGIDSMSDYAVSFHYVSAKRMYYLEYYVYHLRPYGITSGHQDLNLPHPKALDT